MAAEDAGAVARLAGELGYPADPGEIASRLSPLAGRSDHALFVAEAGEVVGWLHVSEDASLTGEPAAEIRALVVDARFRGRGVGRALAAAAEAWAASRRHVRVRVRSRVARADARRFYEGAGYALSKTQNVFEKPVGPSVSGATRPAAAG